jgi:hypothetical protein
MIRLPTWVAVLVAILIAPVSKAFPWGSEGHEAVCEIGYRELTEAVKTRLS